MKFNEFGRSMVEMLGVLAIIGVLSVGAIAGYSKAMMKYRLNKHAESFNMLLNNALQMQDKLAYDGGYGVKLYYGDLFNKLNLIPDGFSYVSNSAILDNFKNNMFIYHQQNSPAEAFGALGIQLQSDDVEICRNIVTVAKENSANLSSITIYKYYSDNTHTSEDALFGDNYCGNDKKCLYNLNINDLDKVCNNCDGTHCQLYIIWKPTK